MTLENLFEIAVTPASVLGLSPREVLGRTSKPAGYLIVGLHTRNFLDISAYHVRQITALTKEKGNGRYHEPGISHEILRGNFSIDAITSRELYFVGELSRDTLLQRLRVTRDCGYSFPFDFSALNVTAADGHTSVVVPEEQFVRARHYRPEMDVYIHRTRENRLVLPSPTLYYASSLDETQDAVRLLKEQDRQFR